MPPTMYQTIYQGRKWDAPFTDDAIEGEVTGKCDYCTEPILPEENAVQLPYIRAHLECHLRSALGDVAHLEGRCFCYTGKPDEDQYDSYRESARASLEWMLAHYRGRFHPDTRSKESHD